ncbi:MAG TPA: FecR family protein [Candidatus Polarisedimenticolia bacterium]|nr:FecR family protein [Candidatus Polarisedimenticolia bacterium]
MIESRSNTIEDPVWAAEEARLRVRRIAHLQWHEDLKARRRWWIASRIKGSIAAAAAVLAVTLPGRRACGGTLEASEAAGTLIVSAGVLRGPGSGPLPQGSELPRGATLVTGGHDRAALRLSGGASVRLNADTRVVLEDMGLLALTHGALYVDSVGDGGPSPNLAIRTWLGSLRAAGARFQVRVRDEALTVGVRQGSVIVDRDGARQEIESSNELTLTRDGGFRTKRIEPFGPAWDWILDVAPEFVLEGRTLGEFLDWLSAETGLRVRLAGESSEGDLTGIVLHGSIAGVRPDRTPDAVLPACGLAHRLTMGAIEIGPAAPEHDRR